MEDDLETLSRVPSGKRIRLYLQCQSKPYDGYIYHSDGRTFISPYAEGKKERPLIALTLEKGSRFNGWGILGYDSLEPTREIRSHSKNDFSRPVSFVPRSRKSLGN